MSTMPSVGAGTYSPGPNMVCSPEQEKVGTGSIEAIIYPVYTISESALQCQLGDRLFSVRSAWDALAYDRYEPGSREEGLAGSVLQAYSGATREPTIKLTHPMQVRVLDAFAEAAGVPHERGQAEIEIPEKLRNYNRYLMSAEYQTRL